MSKTYDRLTSQHIKFIEQQKLFFVATAPLSADGRVNMSPKGHDSLRVINDRFVEWVDLGGSGIETQAHLQENGRITLMYCAFEGAANILRIYGRGVAIDFDNPDFDEALGAFPQFERARAVIRIEIDRVSDSCGWGVPIFDYKDDRDQLTRWVENLPYQEWKEKRYVSNSESIDALPGLRGAQK